MERKKASNNRNAKFSIEEINAIMSIYRQGIELRKQASQCSYEALAKKFNVKRDTIYNLVKGYSYKNVKRS